MTKSIVITYQEADESFLMTFFKRFGIQTKYVKNTSNEPVLAYIADINTEENVEIKTKTLIEAQEEQAILPPRQNIDLSQLIGGFKNKMTIEEDEDATSDFWSPRKKTGITKLRGALKLNMTIEQIDSLTKNWRNEWERDFS